MKKWRVARSLLAITLSAAVAFTAVPETSFVSNAAEAYEVTAPDEEPVVEAPVTDAPVVDAPVVSGGDVTEPVTPEEPVTDPTTPADPVEDPAVPGEPVVEEPTVSDGDSTLDPELYQSKKLKITPKQTTVFTGQSDVLVAQIGYESTTSDDGLGYEVSSITYEGQEYSYGLSYDNENPDALYLTASVSTYPGKYEITLLPVVPDGIYAEPAKLAVNVVPSINRISLTCPEVVYKEPGKALSCQIQATTLDYRDGKPNKPTALNWSVSVYDEEAEAYVSYTGKDITVTGGKLTIAGNLETGDGVYLKITARAVDYEGNSANNSCYVKVISEKLSGGKAIIERNYIYQFKDKDTVSYKELNGTRLRVLTADSSYEPGDIISGEDMYDTKRFTYKSSSKDVLIDSDGTISVLKVSGKPVTFTATSLDGKYKTSITVTLKKKPLDISQTVITFQDGIHYYGSTSGSISPSTPDGTVKYTGNQTQILLLQIFDGGYGPGEIYDYSYTIKGAKNVTSTYQKMEKDYQKYNGSWSALFDSYIAIIPTSQVVEITVKSGKETKTYKLENTAFKTEKYVALKGEPKLTTSYSLYDINDSQQIKLYVGKQNAGGTAKIYQDDATVYASYGNLQSYYRMGRNGSYTVDKDGYITLSYSSVKAMVASFEADLKSLGLKFLKDYKYQIQVTDKDGKTYAPYLFTLKFTKNTPKTDYRLQTSYKITKQRMGLNLEYADWENYDEDDPGYHMSGYQDFYYYYQQLTYSGSKEPTDTIQFVDFSVDLGKNLLDGSDLAQNLDICRDDYGNYYVAVYDGYAGELLYEANQKIIAEGKDVTKYGKDAKVDGYVYITYNIITKEGYVIPKKDKVKVSVVIPKSDWTRLD
ncbi:MAG: hypothetical protein ACI4EX_03030 [Lachnospiraceae bacterium]